MTATARPVLEVWWDFVLPLLFLLDMFSMFRAWL
jgi:hypothetical protein